MIPIYIYIHNFTHVTSKTIITKYNCNNYIFIIILLVKNTQFFYNSQKNNLYIFSKLNKKNIFKKLLKVLIQKVKYF